MKKSVLFLMVLSLFMSCNGQNKGAKENATKEKVNKENVMKEQPKGSWKVDKEFDENGSLIRYDSIYSWSSSNSFDDLSTFNRDSLLQSFESKFFSNFSHFENQGFSELFAQDSVFSKHFFNDDFFDSSFGKDFMNLDKIREDMLIRQRKFLEKYRSEFMSPITEN